MTKMPPEKIEIMSHNLDHLKKLYTIIRFLKKILCTSRVPVVYRILRILTVPSIYTSTLSVLFS